jgi:hypothetical protein
MGMQEWIVRNNPQLPFGRESTLKAYVFSFGPLEPIFNRHALLQ